MRRGDIVIARLDPALGSEAAKTRPVLIVGRDAHTATSLALGRGVVTVVPVTSNIDRVLSFQVLLPATATGLECDSKAQCEQIRSIDVRRLGRIAGLAPQHLMTDVDRALRIHLAL